MLFNFQGTIRALKTSTAEAGELSTQIRAEERVGLEKSTGVSVINAEGPPVPIPNTEVKLCYGEDTCLETGRENSSLLTPIT